jgi:FAD/FMN-containing dehydrogenase
MKLSSVIRSLINILGTDKVLYCAGDLERYSRDALDVTRALPANFRPSMPIAIVRPDTEDDVSAVVKFANRKRIPIVPYGAGTGLMGGAATIKRSIVMDMRNMNSIEINKDDFTVDVGAGIVIKELASEVEKHGLMFAHDPWSASYSTVGGAIATNGVGYLACKYGSMGEQVLGLRAVAGNNSLIDIKPAKKRSTGFDLGNLFIGSEGILGIITSATLRLYPMPEQRKIHAFGFKDLARGYRCVRQLFLQGVQPTSLDLFEVFDVKADADTRTWLQDEEGTRLYLLFDGFQEEVNALSIKTKQIVKEFNGTELDDKVAEEYWKSRYDLANRYISFIRQNSRNTDIKFDFIQVYVPAGKLLEFDKVCRDIAEKYRVVVQGHGIWQALEFYSMNLFAHSADANDRMYQAIDEMLRHAIEVGTMEYVHGVGIRLAHLMKETHSDGMTLIRKIKRVLDPNNIMNPGKLSL